MAIEPDVVGAAGTPSGGAKGPSSVARGIGAAMLVVMVALIVLRAPQIFTQGRVYGEEGAYLGTAWRNGPHALPVWTEPAVGYLMLHVNLAAYLAAHVLPLRYAAWLFTFLATVTALLPYAFVLADPRWRNRLPLLLALPLLLLFVAPSAEVWINMACGQFPLSLAAAVLLALEAPRDRWRLARLATLFFAGTAGMASVVLAPLFVARAIWERDAQRWVQAGLLCACLALQGSLVRKYSAGRPHYQLTANECATVVTAKQLQVPFLGFETQDPGSPDMSPGTRLWTIGFLQSYRQMTVAGWAVMWVAPLCIYGIPLLLALRARDRASLFMVASAATMVFASLWGSLHPPELLVSAFVAERYYFAPNVLLAIVLLRSLADGRELKPWWRAAAAAALLWLVVVGVREFFRPNPGYFDSPSWFAEVRAWEKDHSRPLRFAPGWQLELK